MPNLQEWLGSPLLNTPSPDPYTFERRLGRRLNQRERDIFARQLDVLGPERLGDLVLDSTPQQLAAWLDLASIG